MVALRGEGLTGLIRLLARLPLLAAVAAAGRLLRLSPVWMVGLAVVEDEQVQVALRLAA
jgi:hypothetical protein